MNTIRAQHTSGEAGVHVSQDRAIRRRIRRAGCVDRDAGSGGSGINSWRTSHDLTTRRGKNVEKTNNTRSGWFLRSVLALGPYILPHDHHELIAMVAPRAIIALGNPDYDWLGDESGYKSVMAAMEVLKAMGVAVSLGYDFTGGHTHCQAASNQSSAVTAFVNRFLKGQTASTAIAVKPSKSTFDLN